MASGQVASQWTPATFLMLCLRHQGHCPNLVALLHAVRAPPQKTVVSSGTPCAPAALLLQDRA
eukprot:6201365-Pleurochrysis_carterae.AAC.2